MSIRLDIQNFRAIETLSLHSDRKMDIIVGYNEAGKSSLVGAIQFAFTGGAFGHKGKDIERLVRRGSDRPMSVRVQVGNQIVGRTKTTGDPQKAVAERLGVPTDVLPLLFDAKMNGDGGSKAMRTFLDGVASSLFNAAEHFKNDPAIIPLIEMAHRAGRLTTRQIISYCEDMRAGTKAPSEPIMPSWANPSDEGLKTLRRQEEEAAAVWAKTSAESNENFLLVQQIEQIIQYRNSLVSFEGAKARASVSDPLKNIRDPLIRVLNINENTIPSIQNLIHTAGWEQLAAQFDSSILAIQSAKLGATSALNKHPAPPGLPPVPILPPTATSLYDELIRSNVDLATLPNMAVTARKNLMDSRDAVDKAAAGKNEMSKLLGEANQRRGAWDAYNLALPMYDENKIKSETDWKRWDLGAKQILAAEMHHMNQAGDAFASMVTDFGAYVLNGRKLKISRDEGIWLGADPIDECSKSCQWRIEVAIMAAVALTLKSPLLVIDGADILDAKNRALVSAFLIERIVPRFEHTLLTMTPRGKIEEEQTAEQKLVGKWVMTNGELSELK